MGDPQELSLTTGSDQEDDLEHAKEGAIKSRGPRGKLASLPPLLGTPIHRNVYSSDRPGALGPHESAAPRRFLQTAPILVGTAAKADLYRKAHS